MEASRYLSLTGRQGSLMAVAAALARCSSSSQPMQLVSVAADAWLSCSSCCTAAACSCVHAMHLVSTARCWYHVHLLPGKHACAAQSSDDKAVRPGQGGLQGN